MGYLTHVDGRCYVCKQHTDIFCDFCRKYICPDHRVDRGKHFVFCKECEDQKKPPVHSKRKIANHEYVEPFLKSKGYDY